MPQDDKKRWEDRAQEFGAKVQDEVQRVVRYLDEEVVPEVRRNSSTALRAAAERLQKLAEHMDENRQDKQEKP